MSKILFQNARVVSSSGVKNADVLVDGAKIVKVGKGGSMKTGKAETFGGASVISNGKGGAKKNGVKFKGEIVDCSREGLYLLPGLIDAHVHFREPGLTQKGDFASESRAALAGGITTIFDMPNTKPPTTTVEAFKEKLALAKKKCLCDFKLFMAVVVRENGSDNLDEIEKVYKSKTLSKYLAGVKVYMAHSTGSLGPRKVVDGLKIGMYESLERVLADKVLNDLPVVVHAEDPICIAQNISKFDPRKPVTWSKARPKECAVIAVREACHLAKKYERKIHIAHVSSREEALVAAKFRPLVTCEVSPHHLFFNTSMYGRYGKFLMVNPPVRSRAEVMELWQAVYNGEIDVIATDHSPHTHNEKTKEMGMSGMPDVQTVLPMFLNEISRENFGFKDLVRMYCENPAYIFGLKDRGCIAEGMKADLVLVDAKMKGMVWEDGVMYKCRWSNYSGKSLRGWPLKVWKDGKVV